MCRRNREMTQEPSPGRKTFRELCSAFGWSIVAVAALVIGFMVFITVMYYVIPVPKG